jgi:hypothetical protein
MCQFCREVVQLGAPECTLVGVYKYLALQTPNRWLDPIFALSQSSYLEREHLPNEACKCVLPLFFAKKLRYISDEFCRSILSPILKNS